MNMYPGSEMPVYPVSWRSIDTEKGWVISEIMNQLRHPATAPSTRVPSSTTDIQAGDGLWSYEEDAYNPMNFLVMVQGYTQACAKLGTLSDDARVFAQNMSWKVP